MNSLEQIFEHKIVAIIRGAEPTDVLKIAEALYAGGIRLMEVTLNSPGALQLIRELKMEMEGRMLIGAGTVLNVEDATKAIDAGASFIISPIVDVPTIEFTKQNNIVSVPGAYTATEIHHAFSQGADIIKVFPASSNHKYISEIRGPLPHIPLMPTGGITVDNIGEFVKAGAVAFGIGGALVDTKKAATVEHLKEIKDKAKKFVQALNNAER
ncbi:MAG: bifunctional 4-hydroxy-2-oxoglutarate aldolase/2-dehydro-3-deoxy-phosphogluconate aldolase [Flavisolibacter sp.]